MTYGRDDPGQQILVGERLPWDCHRGTPDAVLLQTTWPAAHSETDAGAGVLDSDQRGSDIPEKGACSPRKFCACLTGAPTLFLRCDVDAFPGLTRRMELKIADTTPGISSRASRKWVRFEMTGHDICSRLGADWPAVKAVNSRDRGGRFRGRQTSLTLTTTPISARRPANLFFFAMPSRRGGSHLEAATGRRKDTKPCSRALLG